MTYSQRVLSFCTGIMFFVFLFAVPLVYAIEWGAVSDTGFELSNISAYDDSTVLAVGYSGVILFSEDGGETWEEVSSGTEENLFGVSTFDSNNAFAVGDGGTILQSTDSGASWTDISSGETSETLYNVHMLNPSVGIIAEGTGNVLVTNDGGNTWNLYEARNSVRLYDAVAVTEDIFWAVGNSGSILTSNDGGVSWTNVGTTGYVYRSVTFLNELEGWIAGYSSTTPVLLHTTDGGTTWIDETPSGFGSDDDIYDIQFLDEDNGVFVISAGLIYTTSDGGVSWDLAFETSEELTSISIVNEESQWVAGIEGGIYALGEEPASGTSDTTEPTVGSVWPTTVSTGTSAFYATVSDDVEIDTCSLYIDGSEDGAMTVSSSTAQRNHLFSSSGSYTLYVRCTDTSGNSGTGSSVTVTVSASSSSSSSDTQDPSVGAVTPTTATIHEETTLSASVADNIDVSSCDFYVNDKFSGDMTVDSGSASIDFTFLNTGTKTVYVRCYDPAGNSGDGSETTITVSSSSSSGSSSSDSSSIDTDTLIKLPCNGGEAADHFCKAVYYYGDDGQRHAFPNEKVYFTWYDDFDDVQIVSSEDMSSISLGSNVTYHPGTRMVTFQSTNEVYAVSQGAELRYVTSEDIAEELYGSNWNKQIDDISDAFFGNYLFGADIEDADDYDVDEEKTSVSSVSDNL